MFPSLERVLQLSIVVREDDDNHCNRNSHVLCQCFKTWTMKTAVTGFAVYFPILSGLETDSRRSEMDKVWGMAESVHIQSVIGLSHRHADCTSGFITVSLRCGT